MAYQWKTFAYKTDANIAGAECEKLSSTVGLTPQNLVDASRAEDAPLHAEFEWNDEVAAEGYRRHQAALIISNLAIVVEQVETENVRAFFSLEGGFRKQGVYESTIRIMEESDKRKQLLTKAKRELQAFQNKYKLLKELAGVFSEIEKLD